MSARWIPWAKLAFAVTCACGAPPPDTPSAVIQADPETLCQGDAFRTPVTLDASASTPRLTLVPVSSDPETASLSYEWVLSGAAHELVSGTLRSRELVVVTAADRPLHAELTVRDDGGGVATTFLTVAITEPDPATGECPEELGP